MLIDNFYKVLSSAHEDNEWHFEVVLPVSCHIYRGHFPEKPIAPGVCLIEMVRELSEQAIGRPLRITSITKCKFSALLLPSDTDVLQVNIRLLSSNDNEITIDASVCKQATTYTRMQAMLS